MSTASRVESFVKEGPTKISRWPGVAVRTSAGLKAGQIDFRRGTVIRVTDLIIYVEMDHRLYRLVRLMGDSYSHWCQHCTATIPGNVTYRRPAEDVFNSRGELIPIRMFCPYCGPDHILQLLKPGDKLRLHYRFEQDASAGGWYAEKWPW